MHSANPGTHLPQRRQEFLYLLRIPHDHRKGHRTHLLHSAKRPRFRASQWPSAPHRRAPSLRKPFQKVASFSPVCHPPPSEQSALASTLSVSTALACPVSQITSL